MILAKGITERVQRLPEPLQADCTRRIPAYRLGCVIEFSSLSPATFSSDRKIMAARVHLGLGFKRGLIRLKRKDKKRC